MAIGIGTSQVCLKNNIIHRIKNNETTYMTIGADEWG